MMNSTTPPSSSTTPPTEAALQAEVTRLRQEIESLKASQAPPDYGPGATLPETHWEQQYQAQTFKAVLGAIQQGLIVFRVLRNEAGDLNDLIYEFVSDQVTHDAGLRREQMIGQSLCSLFPSVVKSAHWTVYEQALQTGLPQPLEEHYQYDDFDNYIVSQILPVDGDRLIVSYQIINELKQAQVKAEQQSALLQSIFDNAQVGLVLFEILRDETGKVRDFRYLQSNPVNDRILGRPAGEIIGRTVYELYPALRGSEWTNNAHRCAELGEPTQFAYSYEGDGVRGWFDATFVRIDNRMLLTYTDVTALKDAEQLQTRQAELLRSTNEVLLRSNESLQNFAYVASHDLQEPLRKIQSFGDLVIDRFGNLLPAEGQDMLQRMQAAADRMSNLIHDLLALSRLSTQKQPFRPIDLGRLLTGILTDLELVVVQTGAKIEITQLPIVTGDRVQLGQLFQNLLTNALKFQVPGTIPRVQIDCRHVGTADVPAGLLSPAFAGDSNPAGGRPRHYFAISVTDNGIGFDADTHGERVFGAFQRLHGKSQYTGTGIGLAIAKKVVDNHGGGIRVDSKPGDGAAFTIYLPAND
ncbi:MAG: hypothetical protein EAZ91_24780 [Cytophagales bacterium]|nr:MAG: hypothetical protein EAZ91_24780 [Cytophagales bacterium]